MIEVENTDVNIVRNLIPMKNHMPASAYGLKAISDWFTLTYVFVYKIEYNNPAKSARKFKHEICQRYCPCTKAQSTLKCENCLCVCYT